MFSGYELWPLDQLNMFDLGEIPQTLYNNTIEDANRYLNFDWGSLTASMYTDAQHSDYSDIVKLRRKALACLALAEHAERKSRYLEDIINGIWCICEESTWILPDNSGYLRDIENPRFDADAAATAALLALSVHLFRKELPVMIKKRAVHEIKKRVLRPFEDAKQLAPYSVSQTLVSCLFAENDDEKRRTIVDKSIEALDIFLGEFTKNGIKTKNDQGLYTWSAYIFDILEMIYNATDQKFEAFSDERLKYAADFIYKIHMGSDGFAENVTEEDGPRTYLFGKRMDSKKLIDFGASEFLKIEDKTLPDSTNLFHKLYSLKYTAEVVTYGDNFDEQECGYIESMDLFVKKTKTFSVAIKGGSNAAGNFMAYLENEPYIVDLEKSHNLPMINGFYQFPNTKKATVEVLENGLALDLSKTYPKEAGVISWMRSIEAEEKYIIITDDYELSKLDDLKCILLLNQKPIISENRILAGDASILWDGNIALRVELVKSKTYDFVYRMLFHVKSNDFKGRISIALKK